MSKTKKRSSGLDSHIVSALKIKRWNQCQGIAHLMYISGYSENNLAEVSRSWLDIVVRKK